MSGWPLKFDNTEVNLKESHSSKQPINLNLVDINKIALSYKFKRNDKSFKYFIGYKYDNIVRPLCNILPQKIGYTKFSKRRKKYAFFDRRW